MKFLRAPQTEAPRLETEERRAQAMPLVRLEACHVRHQRRLWHRPSRQRGGCQPLQCDAESVHNTEESHGNYNGHCPDARTSACIHLGCWYRRLMITWEEVGIVGSAVGCKGLSKEVPTLATRVHAHVTAELVMVSHLMQLQYRCTVTLLGHPRALPRAFLLDHLVHLLDGRESDVASEHMPQPECLQALREDVVE